MESRIPSTHKLNPKQDKFCREYLVDLNATQAAIRSGYSKKTAGSQGFDLLKKPEIQSRLEIYRAELAAKTEATPERILRELCRIAFGDLRQVVSWTTTGIVLVPSDQLTVDEAAMVAEVSETKFGTRVKLHDKLKAIEMIGRHLGMWATEAGALGAREVPAGNGFRGTLEDLLVTYREVNEVSVAVMKRKVE